MKGKLCPPIILRFPIYEDANRHVCRNSSMHCIVSSSISLGCLLSCFLNSFSRYSCFLGGILFTPVSRRGSRGSPSVHLFVCLFILEYGLSNGICAYKVCPLFRQFSKLGKNCNKAHGAKGSTQVWCVVFRI